MNKHMGAMYSAMRVGDLKRFEMEEKNLLRETLKFANWVQGLSAENS